jgi:hypothetical protein
LLSQLAPNIVTATNLTVTDPRQRCELVLSTAERLGCRKFITKPDDILEPNPKLNLAFTAYLFNKFPGISIEKLDQHKKQMLEEIERQLKVRLIEEERIQRERWQREDEERRRRWEIEEVERKQCVVSSELLRFVLFSLIFLVLFNTGNGSKKKKRNANKKNCE